MAGAEHDVLLGLKPWNAVAVRREDFRHLLAAYAETQPGAGTFVPRWASYLLEKISEWYDRPQKAADARVVHPDLQRRFASDVLMWCADSFEPIERARALVAVMEMEGDIEQFFSKARVQ